MQNFVFDSLPLLTFFRKQNGWELISRMLSDAKISGQRHVMSAINWGEVYYTVLRDEGREIAAMVNDRISRSAIEIIVPSMEQVVRAAEFKAGGGISYADCFAAALAVERNIPVLTGDPEFQNLEKHGVKIEWLPKNR
jgi:ribonuclease VapC